MQQLRAEVLLAENIRALLAARGLDAQALAMWCGHKPSWISKVIAGSRGVQTRDLGKIADFFGLTISQLFQHGISPLTERRRVERRSPHSRRSGEDRRKPQEFHSRIHPDVPLFFNRSTSERAG